MQSKKFQLKVEGGPENGGSGINLMLSLLNNQYNRKKFKLKVEWGPEE